MKLRNRQDIRTALATMSRRGQSKGRVVGGPKAAPDCPPGWEIGPPDYVGVGTQKAGTTWWNRAIASHPHVQSSWKELHFFQYSWNKEFGEAEAASYHRHFPRPAGAFAGEWTPRYMLDPWTPRQLRRSAPGARILVLLRDPTARLRSGLRHVTRQYSDELDPRFVNEAVSFGLYGEQLERLARHYPREQILVLQLERCIEDPQGELARTFAFIGVDPSFVPEGLHDRVNESRRTDLTIDSDLIDHARELYAADRNLLSEWDGIDFDLWSEIIP